MRFTNMTRVLVTIAALATPSCGAVPHVALPILTSDVVRPAAKRVTLCDANGCVSLTRDELRAVARDL